MKNLKWYHFDQNNSGGSFDIDACVDKSVYIQAYDAESANNIAESVGIYFDGCDAGLDCECCGDRWSRLYWDEDGHEVPTCYGKPVTCDFDSKFYPYGHSKPVKLNDLRTVPVEKRDDPLDLL